MAGRVSQRPELVLAAPTSTAIRASQRPELVLVQPTTALRIRVSQRVVLVLIQSVAPPFSGSPGGDVW
jgi:hypothetical protein